MQNFVRACVCVCVLCMVHVMGVVVSRVFLFCVFAVEQVDSAAVDCFIKRCSQASSL